MLKRIMLCLTGVVLLLIWLVASLLNLFIHPLSLSIKWTIKQCQHILYYIKDNVFSTLVFLTVLASGCSERSKAWKPALKFGGNTTHISQTDTASKPIKTGIQWTSK